MLKRLHAENKLVKPEEKPSQPSTTKLSSQLPIKHLPHQKACTSDVYEFHSSDEEAVVEEEDETNNANELSLDDQALAAYSNSTLNRSRCGSKYASSKSSRTSECNIFGGATPIRTKTPEAWHTPLDPLFEIQDKPNAKLSGKRVGAFGTPELKRVAKGNAKQDFASRKRLQFVDKDVMDEDEDDSQEEEQVRFLYLCSVHSNNQFLKVHNPAHKDDT
jgi:hypothetical protein